MFDDDDDGYWVVSLSLLVTKFTDWAISSTWRKRKLLSGSEYFMTSIWVETTSVAIYLMLLNKCFVSLLACYICLCNSKIQNIIINFEINALYPPPCFNSSTFITPMSAAVITSNKEVMFSPLSGRCCLFVFVVGFLVFFAKLFQNFHWMDFNKRYIYMYVYLLHVPVSNISHI